jgi:hypothetical protein
MAGTANWLLTDQDTSPHLQYSVTVTSLGHVRTFDSPLYITCIEPFIVIPIITLTYTPRSCSTSCVLLSGWLQSPQQHGAGRKLNRRRSSPRWARNQRSGQHCVLSLLAKDIPGTEKRIVRRECFFGKSWS